MSLRDKFIAFDDRLAQLGTPPLTAWWREGIGEWLDRYEQTGVLELWGCAGRGSSKSTSLYKLCVFFTLFVHFNIPTAERHFAIVLSRLKEEATKGIGIIANWLTRLGVPHHVASEVIELENMPRGIRVVAASVAATSGWRAYFIGKDERSKWAADGAIERDAEEIDASGTAMTASHALAPSVAFGSAWGQFGGFYDAIMGGTTERRHVLGPAPTWVAAPHITRESLERKEDNPSIFAREYECVFSGSSSDVFTAENVDPAFAKPRFAMKRIGFPVLILDPSSGKRDVFSYAVGGWWGRRWAEKDMWLWVAALDPNEGHGADRYLKPVPGHTVIKRDAMGHPVPNPEYGSGEPVFALSTIGGYENAIANGYSANQIVDEMVALCQEEGIRHVVSDQREDFTLEAAFRQRGLYFKSLAWTNANKGQAVAWVSRLLRERRLGLVRHEKMRAELLNFKERLQPNGVITYEGRRSDDFVAILLTAALSDMAGLLNGSPNRIPSTRETFGPGDGI
jgi:hypothetical protein